MFKSLTHIGNTLGDYLGTVNNTFMDTRMDRVRNEEVRRRDGIEMELASRADQRVLRWFGHMERMDDYRMARRVLMAEVSGG